MLERSQIILLLQGKMSLGTEAKLKWIVAIAHMVFFAVYPVPILTDKGNKHSVYRAPSLI